jgi:hypothetical protein
MRRTVAILLVLCTPAAARAQNAGREQSAAQKGVENAVAPANLSLGAIPGASAGPGQQATSVQAILDASIKEKVGTASFGWKTGKRQVQLSFSGPVGSTDEATPISLTGLSPGAKAKLSMNRWFWRAPNPIEQKALVELCTRLKLGFPETSSGVFTEEDFEKAKKMPPCRASTITNPEDRAMYEHLSHLHAIPWMLGFDGTAGQTTHKFVQEGSLEPGTEKNLEWSFSGRAGFHQQGLGFVLATYSYAESSAAARPAAQICRPMTGITAEGGATRCENLVVGIPTPKTTSAITAELRRLVSNKFAMSPSVTYDFKENKDGQHVWGFEVPVYFLTTSGTTNPTGGVRFGWRSDTKEVTAVVFIGGAFKLFSS